MQRLAETVPHRNQHARIVLRDYQRDALDAIDKAQDRGLDRVLVQLPTGAGKTVVFAHLISQFIGQGAQS